MFEGMSRRSFVKALAASAMSSSTIKSSLGQERVAASQRTNRVVLHQRKTILRPFQPGRRRCRHHATFRATRARAGILGRRLRMASAVCCACAWALQNSISL